MAHTPITDSMLRGGSKTTGGYGYIPGRSGESEASAMRLFSDSCQSYCEYNPLTTTSITGVENTFNSMDKDKLVRKLREKVLEMKMLKLAANPELVKIFAANKVGFMNYVPGDLRDQGKNFIGLLQIQDLASIRSSEDSYSDGGMSRIKECLFSEPKDPRLGYYFAFFGPESGLGGSEHFITNVGGQKKFSSFTPFSSEKSRDLNIQAIIWNDFLEKAKTKYKYYPDELSSVLAQQRRLHESYSDLFGATGNGYRTILKKSIYRALGVESPEEIFTKKVGDRGDYTYNSFIRENAGTRYPELVDKVFSKIDMIEEAGTKEGKKFLQKLDDIETKFNLERIDKDTQDLNSVCDLDINSIVKKYPNVIRQAMADGSDEDRSLIFSLLCSYGLKDEFTSPKICGKVSGSLASPSGMTINKTSLDYPFSSGNVKLNFTRNSENQRITLNKKIYLSGGNGLSPDEKTKVLESMKSSFENDWRCETGQIKKVRIPKNSTSLNSPKYETRKCPSDEAVEYDNPPEINLIIEWKTDGMDTSDGTTMNIHRCFNSDILNKSKRSDCTEVRKHGVNNCVKRKEYEDFFIDRDKPSECFDEQGNLKTQETDLNSCCEKVVDIKFKEDPDSLNRANASNLSINSSHGTWKHELLHQFGINDEYSNQSYPFSPQGHYYSIMNNSKKDKSRIQPHHIEEIVDNLNCQ